MTFISLTSGHVVCQYRNLKLPQTSHSYTGQYSCLGLSQSVACNHRYRCPGGGASVSPTLKNNCQGHRLGCGDLRDHGDRFDPDYDDSGSDDNHIDFDFDNGFDYSCCYILKYKVKLNSKLTILKSGDNSKFRIIEH